MIWNKIICGGKYLKGHGQRVLATLPPGRHFGAKKRIDLFEQRNQLQQASSELQLPGQADFLSVSRHAHQQPINLKEFLSNDLITEHDITHFDTLYRTSNRTSVRRQGYSRVVSKGSMKINIPNVLQLKLGKNYDKIVFFLRQRSEYVTEIELHYCFLALSEMKLFKRFQLEETELLYSTVQTAARIEYMNYTHIVELMTHSLYEDLQHTGYLKQLATCAHTLIKDKKYHNIVLRDIKLTLRLLKHQHIRSLFPLATFVDYLSGRIFDLTTDITALIDFVKAISKYSDFAEGKAYVNFENFIEERRELLSLQDLIDILSIYASSKVSQSYLYTDLLPRLRRQNVRIEKVLAVQVSNASEQKEQGPLLMSEHQAATLIWIVSQIEQLNQKEELWVYLESKYLQFLQDLKIKKMVVEKTAFSTVLYSLDASERGNQIYWSFPFAKVLQNEHETVQVDFDDLLIIFYNKLRFMMFDIEIFKGMVVDAKATRMNYIQKLGFKKINRILFSYLCGIDYSWELLARVNAEDEGLKPFKEDVDLIAGYIGAQLQFYLQQEFRMKEIEVNDMLRFFICLGYGMYVGIFKLKEDVLKTWFIELKYKYDRCKDMMPKVLINAFLWKFNEKIGIKRDVFEEDLVLFLKNSFVVELLPVIEEIYFLDYNDDYVWTIIELKLIEYCESLSPIDFLKMLAILHFKKLGSEEFWQYCLEYYSGTIVHCVGDTEVRFFNKFFGSSLPDVELPEVASDTMDEDSYDRLKEVVERPSLLTREVHEYVDHAYRDTLRSPLNYFYLSLLRASF